ncbi:MAG: hypothetical protein ABRQ37_28840 [Candidatus Eremiobacterota bacterium]
MKIQKVIISNQKESIFSLKYHMKKKALIIQKRNAMNRAIAKSEIVCKKKNCQFIRRAPKGLPIAIICILSGKARQSLLSYVKL